MALEQKSSPRAREKSAPFEMGSLAAWGHDPWLERGAAFWILNAVPLSLYPFPARGSSATSPRSTTAPRRSPASDRRAAELAKRLRLSESPSSRPSWASADVDIARISASSDVALRDRDHQAAPTSPARALEQLEGQLLELELAQVVDDVAGELVPFPSRR